MRDRDGLGPRRRPAAGDLLALALLTATPAFACTPTADSPAAPSREIDHRPRFVPADSEAPILEQIRAARAAAEADAAVALVYIGASWCEPCMAFHEAVESGTYDRELADLRMLEFDADRDGERLIAAGYGMRLIPALVAPEADGSAGELRLEGGIKGAGAADHVLARLVPIVEAQRRAMHAKNAAP